MSFDNRDNLKFYFHKKLCTNSNWVIAEKMQTSPFPGVWGVDLFRNDPIFVWMVSGVHPAFL